MATRDWPDSSMSSGVVTTGEGQTGDPVVPSGSSPYAGQGYQLGTPGNMEVDGPARGRSIDWQFYLDTLVLGLSTEISQVATLLLLSAAELKALRKTYNGNEHEINFHVLWAWHKKQPAGKNDDSKLKTLHDALKDAGLTYLTQDAIPTRGTYEYQGVVRSGQDNVTALDALKVANKVGGARCRLGRFFELNESEIDRHTQNNSDEVQNQGKSILEACKNSNILTTRQDLCNGLNYVEDIALIEEMNTYWDGL